MKIKKKINVYIDVKNEYCGFCNFLRKGNIDGCSLFNIDLKKKNKKDIFWSKIFRCPQCIKTFEREGK